MNIDFLSRRVLASVTIAPIVVMSLGCTAGTVASGPLSDTQECEQTVQLACAKHVTCKSFTTVAECTPMLTELLKCSSAKVPDNSKDLIASCKTRYSSAQTSCFDVQDSFSKPALRGECSVIWGK
jgi:hypothetical protein